MDALNNTQRSRGLQYSCDHRRNASTKNDSLGEGWRRLLNLTMSIFFRDDSINGTHQLGEAMRCLPWA